ncbi:ABC transporter substrate-binding protein [Gracilibacillus alcaliphilus]|uniref:ABC transporter substrate-binding protein n=1 Tax=Gracilibacillus alcaliphilus TaxID=1401441 RepID=UPI001956F431|nr:extracellular solute-binding protein [Gracilibacillus alcaliphilus]MBM7675237.1 multiple sugar transport system substrate-binding protein [Gracilibacillus alcaliphilus]
MKKWVSFIVFGLLVMLLAACNNENTEPTEENSDTEASGDQVVLKMASWSFGTEGDENINRLMLEAFMEEYPDIKVEIDESIGDPWEESLAAAASASNMPDVFSITNVPTGVANDWMLDVKPYLEEDEEFASLPDSVVEAITMGDQIYAIPASQHMLGYYVNKDLFENANLDVPELGMDLDAFNEAVRNVTNINQGIIGLNQTFSIIDWYPAAANEELGWYTFNEEGYHLDSNEFINGIDFSLGINSNGYAYEALTDDQKANFNGEDSNEVWFNQGIGIRWDGTWAISGLGEQSDFEWDFIGIPGERNLITHDYYGISSSTEHPEEAYLLAKWMGFGKDGYLKRLAIAEESETITIDRLPLTTDQEVIDAYFADVDLPGLEKAFENIDNAVVEPFKTTPGYGQSRWEAATGVEIGDEANASIGTLLENAVTGDINYENYAQQVNDLANSKYQEALEALEN